MFNMFLIITPVQYLNAQELINQFGIQHEKNIMIILSGFHKTRDEILSMMVKKDWFKIHVVSKNVAPVGGYNYFKYIYLAKKQLKNILKQYLGISRLIIGNYNDLLSHFMLQKTRFDHLFLLDDGFASLDISRIRFDEVEHGRSILELPRLNNIRLRLTKKILSLNSVIPEKINFFTSYPIQRNHKDTFYVNQYSLLKSTITLKQQDKIAYFIGQPLIELKIVSEDFYVQTISSLTKLYENYTFFYIPHRIENAKKFEHLSQSVEIKEFYLPIELGITKENVLPSAIFTFYSSAIFNLQLIYGDLFLYKLVKIPHTKLHKRKSMIIDFYRNLENNKPSEISFVDLQ